MNFESLNFVSGLAIGVVSGAAATLGGSLFSTFRRLQSIQKKQAQLSSMKESEVLKYSKRLIQGDYGREWGLLNLFANGILFTLGCATLQAGIPIGVIIGAVAGTLAFRSKIESIQVKKVFPKEKELSDVLLHEGINLTLGRQDPEFDSLLQIGMRQMKPNRLAEWVTRIHDKSPEQLPALFREGIEPTHEEAYRLKFLTAVSAIDPALLVPRLPKLLDDKSILLRRVAYEFVNLLPEASAEWYIKKGLASKDPILLDHSLEALSSHPELTEQLQTEREKDLLGEGTSPAAVGFSSEVVRINSMLKSETSPEKAASLKTIKKAILEGSPAVRNAIGLAVGSAEDPEPLNRLLASLSKNASQSVLMTVLVMLKDQNLPEALKAVIALLSEKDVTIRKAAAKVLKKMEGLKGAGLSEQLNSKDPKVVEMAIEVVAGLPADEAIPILTQFIPSKEIRIRAATLTALYRYKEDQRVVDAYAHALSTLKVMDRFQLYQLISFSGDVRMIDPMLAVFKKVRIEGMISEGSRDKNELERFKGTMRDLLEKQPFHGAELTSLLCTRCLTRAEKVSHFQWKIPQCRRCGKRDKLIPKVDQLIGTIGSGFSEPNFLPGKYQVDLWDEEKKKFRYADIDTLEILGGGEFDYDWAVNAVLEGLANGKETAKLKLQIRTEGPLSLSINSQKLIEEVNIN